MKYEVEIKALLDQPHFTHETLSRALIERGFVFEGHEEQLNHYFKPVGEEQDYTPLEDAIFLEDREKLLDILREGKNISVRTRETDSQETRFVMKASVGDDSSENGVRRMEMDVVVNVTLADLDRMILDSGYEYQAKWSRVRDTYHRKEDDITVVIDKNAGYGYLAEFEKVVDNEGAVEKAEADLRELMTQIGVRELDPKRLERMFAHYNENWRDYYGTEKTFDID